jgi:hypothetical protein
MYTSVAVAVIGRSVVYAQGTITRLAVGTHGQWSRHM